VCDIPNVELKLDLLGNDVAGIGGDAAFTGGPDGGVALRAISSAALSRSRMNAAAAASASLRSNIGVEPA
jgi:hypothetical protein